MSQPDPELIGLRLTVAGGDIAELLDNLADILREPELHNRTSTADRIRRARLAAETARQLLELAKEDWDKR